MKKNLLFVIPMIAVFVLLFLFNTTGLPAHIVVSVVGLLVLVAYALATKKSWKCPVFEILERVSYAVALISGVVLINVPQCFATVSLVHKISAILFAVLLVITEVHKAIKK